MFLDDWEEEVIPSYDGDEADIKAWQECARLSEESEEKRNQRRTEEAIARGFSSKEELVEHEMEKSRQIHRDYETQLKEKAALLGKTIEEMYSEIYAEHPQQYSPGGILGPLSSYDCDCDNHPIPTFCPHSLADYRSMDAPDLMGYLDQKYHPQIEELDINQSDKSKRLDEKTLQRVWDTQSQEEPLELLPCFKQDKVMRQIIDSTRLSNLAGLDRSHPCSPSSIFTEDRVDISDDITTPPTSLGSEPDLQSSIHRYESQENGIEGTKRQQVSSKNTSPSLHITTHSRYEQTSKATPRPQQTKISHGARISCKPSRIEKRSLPLSMRTRSHRNTKFYKLSADGVAVSYRAF